MRRRDGGQARCPACPDLFWSKARHCLHLHLHSAHSCFPPQVTLGPGAYSIEETAYWSERVYRRGTLGGVGDGEVAGSGGPLVCVAGSRLYVVASGAMEWVGL